MPEQSASFLPNDLALVKLITDNPSWPTWSPRRRSSSSSTTARRRANCVRAPAAARPVHVHAESLHGGRAHSRTLQV